MFIAEEKGVVLRVLHEKSSPFPQPVAYFSRQLDSVAVVACLPVWAAAALLWEESLKLYFNPVT